MERSIFYYDKVLTSMFGQQWFHGVWSKNIKETRKIAWMELYPLVVAMNIWGEKICNKSIIIHTDNQVVMNVINRQTSKASNLMGLVRLFVLTSLRFNVLFKAVYIKSKDNIMCDLLSRLQVAQFKERAAEIGWKLDPLPLVIPQHFSPDAISLRRENAFFPKL